jgi:copper chaperone
METVTLKVEGMSCGGCVSSVTKALEPIEGVSKVDVTLEPGEATIEFDPAKANQDAFRAAIEDAGFDVVG